MSDLSQDNKEKLYIGVVGSRNITTSQEKYINDFLHCYKNMFEIINKNKQLIIVSGGAYGVDTVAKNWVLNNNKTSEEKIGYKEFLPKDRSKASSYHDRNQEIVNASDSIIAFWDGKSPGTLSTINKAKKSGKQILIIDLNNKNMFNKNEKIT